jgi:4-amino-4-deoxy-L-arabinose transferase-like glycosyltransferase
VLRPALAVGIACALAAIALYGAVAAALPFYDKGEPREALVVRGLRTGDAVLLPRTDGGALPAKPPLFHWLAALALDAGVRPDELAIRLPSVLLGGVGVGATAGVAAWAMGPTAGVLSGAVLASAFEWMRAATQSRVDMTLTVLLVAAVGAGLAVARGAAGRGVARVGWLCAAAAVLAKGPVGVVLPALVVAADALVRGRPTALRAVLDPVGVAAAAVVCVGWYALAWRSGGNAFATRQLLQENVQRFVGWGSVAHRHGMLYYLPALAGGLLPWTLALPAAWRRWRAHRGDVEGALAVWIAVVLGFFLLAAGKRSVYLLPLYPPLAMLLGAGLADAAGRRATHAGALVGVALLVAAAAAGIAAGAADPLLARLGAHLGGSDAVRLPAVRAIVDAERAGIAAALVALAALALAWARGGTRARVAAPVALALVWSVGLTALGTAPVAAAMTARPAGAALRAMLGPGDRVCARGGLDHGFRWYAGRPLPACPRDAAGYTVVVRSRGDAALGRPRWYATRVGDGERELAAPSGAPLVAVAR